MSSTHKRIDLHPSWLAYLEPEFAQSYMQELKAFLLAEKQAGKVIYPASKQIFNAFNSTPLEQVKVVVLGQDPYHGPGQDRKSTRLNSSHVAISYAVFCLKKKKKVERKITSPESTNTELIRSPHSY